jgi:biopolymer transport protein ExbD
MAASVSSGDDNGDMSDINVTQLADVVLVLLIIFLITVPSVLRAAAVADSAPIDVNLPSMEGGATDGGIPTTIWIRGGTEDRPALTINDRPTDRDDLAELIEALGFPPEEISITVRAGPD